MDRDKILASLNGILEVTYRKNKALPIEEKVKLPAMECICALYTAKEPKNAKRIRRTKK